MTAASIRARPGVLAKCIAGCLVSAGAPLCVAGTDSVLNCSDGGSGSLRATIAAAASGDIVVLNPVTMKCSSITLTAGEIAISQSDLYIKYNAANSNRFTISGNYSTTNIHARVFHHTGAGKLKLQRLNIVNGGWSTNDTTASVLGGCVDSSGVVDLESSTISGCTLSARLGLSFFVRGAGVYAAKGIALNHSTIHANIAYNFYSTSGAYRGASVEGAGAFANNYISAHYSTVSDNAAYSVADNSGGGGIFVNNSDPNSASTIEQCTISGNSALRGGGLSAVNFAGGFAIGNSTISGNYSFEHDKTDTAPYTRGSAIFSLGTLTISNSTVAFNDAPTAASPAIFFGKSNYNVRVVSTIVANNTAAGMPYDVSSRFPLTIVGANDLIPTKSSTIAFTFPPLTADPLLLPLADNGGPTQTQAFRTASPAFNGGNNAANFATDQRGTGFSRQAANTDVDIGAYQDQVRDRIFADGFD